MSAKKKGKNKNNRNNRCRRDEAAGPPPPDAGSNPAGAATGAAEAVSTSGEMVEMGAAGPKPGGDGRASAGMDRLARLMEPRGGTSGRQRKKSPKAVELAYRCSPCGAVTKVPALRRPVLIRRVMVGVPRTLRGCPSCGSRQEPALVSPIPVAAAEEQR